MRVFGVNGDHFSLLSSVITVIVSPLSPFVFAHIYAGFRCKR
nr:MAG TPA: hypothetical protein [Caudoviricetes sp.]